MEKGEVKKGVLGGQRGFLIEDMEDLVIPFVMNDVFYPTEDTLKISIKRGSGRGGQEGGYLKDSEGS